MTNEEWLKHTVKFHRDNAAWYRRRAERARMGRYGNTDPDKFELAANKAEQLADFYARMKKRKVKRGRQ